MTHRWKISKRWCNITADIVWTGFGLVLFESSTFCTFPKNNSTLSVVNNRALAGLLTVQVLITLNHVTRYFFKNPEFKTYFALNEPKTAIYKCKCRNCSFWILRQTCKSLLTFKITKSSSRIASIFSSFSLNNLQLRIISGIYISKNLW